MIDLIVQSLMTSVSNIFIKNIKVFRIEGGSKVSVPFLCDVFYLDLV